MICFKDGSKGRHARVCGGLKRHFLFCVLVTVQNMAVWPKGNFHFCTCKRLVLSFEGVANGDPESACFSGINTDLLIHERKLFFCI